jgi:hypothetical protein
MPSPKHKPCAPSDKPETCLWCGSKLGWVTVAEYPPGQHEPIKDEEGRVLRRRLYAEPGCEGAPYCSLRCGFAFATRCARDGVRLVRRSR